MKLIGVCDMLVTSFEKMYLREIVLFAPASQYQSRLTSPKFSSPRRYNTSLSNDSRY